MNWKTTEYGSYAFPYAVKWVEEKSGSGTVTGYRAYYLNRQGSKQIPKLLTSTGQTAPMYTSNISPDQSPRNKPLPMATIAEAQLACERHYGFGTAKAG